jgi:ribosomal protein S26
MTEYIRLTKIAFGTTHDTPPVFLLDEIQKLCRPTNVESSFKQDGTSQMHSQLSLLLTQLAGKLKPVCICTGTNSGKIISITEKSAILPQVLSLTPLVSEYREFWKQLTAFSNQSSSQDCKVKMDSDEDLIDALVYASYQIPRLLCIAHSVWFKLRKQGATNNREFYIQAFEQEAINYYDEMVQILKQYKIDDIAHILLACGVHWIVDNEASNVPGTEISWAKLIQESLVFPYLHGCYVFPFSLIWRVATTPGTSNKKVEIEAKCAELVPNLDVKNLYISYDTLCSWENYNLGVGYETLFASSLAVKYYLRYVSTGKTGYFSFWDIYDIYDWEEREIMDEYKFDFSQGISLPTREVFANVADLGFAVVHNRNIHNAHHDLILPALKRGEIVNIAVQAKASFASPNDKAIEKQLLVSPTSLEQVKQLFWLYLGKEKTVDSIVFLNGSGCCNGLALDFFILVKKLRSKNQQ